MNQLHDVVITISSVAKTDEGVPYAMTRVYHCEFSGDDKAVDNFRKHIEKFKALEDFTQLVSEDN